jgi:HPt (histidine-containing phosphotransfer) domain-containing protein
VFDPEVLRERYDGDEDLLRELALLFVADSPQLLAELRAAVSCGDAQALHRAAHAYKGMVANFGEGEATATALALEEAGRSARLAGADRLVTRLDRAARELESALGALAHANPKGVPAREAEAP